MKTLKTLEQCKEYLGERYILHPDFKIEDNPAISYLDGAYHLLPENIEITRLMAKEIPWPPISVWRVNKKAGELTWLK